MSRPIPDQEQRDRALDTGASFIVQAPAGSGKTELLIQRYLALLGRVAHPEEILAITFTRKAAGEMRQRVVEALRGASRSEPEDAHARTTWRLARAALDNSHSENWALEEHPGRLRIQTIDSFCAELTRQLPLLSGFGSPPSVAEEATDLYREAARLTLRLMEGEEEWATPVQRLVQHLDNDQPYIEALLIDMLARRDHWLRHVVAANPRALLEEALGRLVEERLQSIAAVIPAQIKEQLPRLACYAASNCIRGGKESPITALHDLREWPGAGRESLPIWRGVVELLLTRSGSWRKSPSEAIGFPPPSKAGGEEKARRQEYKAQFGALLEGLSGEQAVADILMQIGELPDGRYTDAQWEVLDALMALLPLAVAQLKVVFRDRGTIDFAELGLAATQALGTPTEPTDIALALDYRLKHLLVDEFQDTSLRQYRLLELLTAGWEAGDGRTLFVVGDPMQSIYRFREAEVGLYLRTRLHGLPNVDLKALTLSVNFRSRRDVVEWVNQTFPQVFPDTEDAARGGVRYSSSDPYRPPLPEGGVRIHPLLGADAEQEALQVVRAVEETRSSDPDATVAVLVRSRTHLPVVLEALREVGIRYQAVEIEHLAARPVVQDLLALTRALIHRADRIAWLAVLRAPWCGLTLSDTTRLVGDDPQGVVWDRMWEAECVDAMTDDGRRRVVRLRERLASAMGERCRFSLRGLVEGTWLSLGGPATVTGEGDLVDAATYFELLEELEEGADLTELAPLAERVSRLYAAPDTRAGESLQVMTIHKAKGLEFDTVIVPGMGRRPGVGRDPLLRWLELPREDDRDDLLMAPIRARGEDSDAISQCLKRLDKERGDNEDARLLYVAATRAKRQLHLLGHCSLKGDEEEVRLGRPAKGSLLEKLWPVVEGVYRKAFEGHALSLNEESDETPFELSLPLRRLVDDWSLPEVPAGVTVTAATAPVTQSGEELEFDWAGDTARRIGIVVHRLLQLIGSSGGTSRWDEGAVSTLESRAASLLAHQGVPVEERGHSLRRVMEALKRTLGDSRGRWILDSGHEEATVEWPLSGVDHGNLVHVVLDRTFVDQEGVRWIIDYKTGAHEGPGVEAFLDNEEHRYRPQLERYARLLSQRDSRPIRLGLYFPLLRGWREWSFRNDPLL